MHHSRSAACGRDCPDDQGSRVHDQERPESCRSDHRGIGVGLLLGIAGVLVTFLLLDNKKVPAAVFIVGGA